MLIAAVSDIHAPKFISLLRKTLEKEKKKLKNIDIFILAGDIVNKGNIQGCKQVITLIKEYYEGPILGVRGNEEYDDRKEKLFSICNEITWLEDNYIILKNLDIVIVGSKGVLDKPTIWQRRNIPDILEQYKYKISKIESILRKFSQSNYFVILVTHYAPRCRTLTGEKYNTWPYLSSTKLTHLIKTYQPHLIIHGHAHLSIKFFDNIGRSKIYNVALPATKKLTIINTKSSIIDFLNI
ncbi:MAG: metallophosphoesterase [Thermoproteales archaeon]|nr:metallophosphoesterase [Thermoproteales archaeon]